MNISTEEFLKIIESTLHNKANFLMVVSQKRIQSSEIKSVTIKPVKISIGDRINFVYRYSNKDITKNYLFEEAFGLIKKMIFDEFCQVLLKTQKNEYHFSSNKNRAVVKNLKSIDEIQEFDYAHDKIKNRLIDNVNNVYLQELGILDSEWRVKPSMQDKYKQINNSTFASSITRLS